MPALTLLTTPTAAEDLGGAVAFGAVVRTLRTSAGITQRDLAAREGLHRNYLGALERGTIANPGLSTTNRLARALDVSVGVLAESFVRPLRTPLARASQTVVVAPAREPGAVALGHALRLLRRRRELTRSVLAERTGMHKNYIGSLEEGAIASPGLLTVTRLVTGLSGPGGSDDLDALAAHVGLLARVFAGEAAQSRALAA